jgi:hypothetical protein
MVLHLVILLGLKHHALHLQCFYCSCFSIVRVRWEDAQEVGHTQCERRL